MNKKPAFAPSDSLKGGPQKLLTMNIEALTVLKYRPKVPFRGFRGEKK